MRKPNLSNQSRRDRPYYLVLYRKNIFQLTIIAICPYMAARGNFDQLRRYANSPR